MSPFFSEAALKRRRKDRFLANTNSQSVPINPVRQFDVRQIGPLTPNSLNDTRLNTTASVYCEAGAFVENEVLLSFLKISSSIGIKRVVVLASGLHRMGGSRTSRRGSISRGVWSVCH